MAVKALATINHGLNNLNNIITNIVTRLDLASMSNGQQQSPQTAASSQSGSLYPLIDANKLKVNLRQIGQQFHSAFNATQLHHALLTRQRNTQILTSQQQVGQSQAPNSQESAKNKVNTDFNSQ